MLYVPTTPILDPLNRTENPLVGPGGTGWSNSYVSTNDGTGVFKDDGITAVSTVDATWATVPWTKTDYTGDVECYASIGAINVTSAYILYTRVTNPGGTSVLGYGGFWNTGGGGTWAIESLDAGNTENVPTAIPAGSGTLLDRNGATLTTFNTGDTFAMTCIGSVNPVITLYYNNIEVGSWTDSRGTPYTHGYIGMGLLKGTLGGGLCNFGGGLIYPSQLTQGVTPSFNKFPNVALNPVSRKVGHR